MHIVTFASCEGIVFACRGEMGKDGAGFLNSEMCRRLLGTVEIGG